MARKYEYEVVAEHVEEDEEISAWVTRLEQEAEEDIAAATVTLRWNKRQVDTVKRAAALFGIPYQTYLKQVVFRQALEDIVRAEPVVGTARAPRDFSYPEESDLPMRQVAEDGP